MLEEKSIYLVFEYAEHDFLVRYSSSTIDYRPRADLPSSPANHPPPLVDSDSPSRRGPQVAPLAALQRGIVPTR